MCEGVDVELKMWNFFPPLCMVCESKLVTVGDAARLLFFLILQAMHCCHLRDKNLKGRRLGLKGMVGKAVDDVSEVGTFDSLSRWVVSLSVDAVTKSVEEVMKHSDSETRSLSGFRVSLSGALRAVVGSVGRVGGDRV